MPRLFKKMPSFNAVAAGQTAIANLPIGLAYHQLLVRYVADVAGTPTDATEAVIADDFDQIRLIVDGDAKWTVTGDQLNKLNAYYGMPFKAGVLSLFFSRPWLRTIAGEDELAYGTADVQTMTLEIDLNAAASNPSLELYAIQGPNRPLGRHVALRRFAYSTAQTGILEISDLPKGNYGLLAMHIEDGAGAIADVEVEANQRIIYDADAALAEAYAEQTDRAWQAGYFHVDFASTNRVSDTLPLVLQDFRQRVNFSTAPGAFSLIAERVEARQPAA